MTDYRALFDLPPDTAYFNAAQVGPLPIKAAEAGHAAYRDKLRP